MKLSENAMRPSWLIRLGWLIGLGFLSSACLAIGEPAPFNTQKTTAPQNTTTQSALLFGIPPSLNSFAPAHPKTDAELDADVNALLSQSGGLTDADVPTIAADHRNHLAWEYSLQADELSKMAWRQARLVSGDYNLSLLISYDKADKKLQSPSLFLIFSGDWDNGVHSPRCDGQCTLDMTINGNQFPSVAVSSVAMDILQFDNPKPLVHQFATAHTIKIRLQSATGQYLTYSFVPNTPLVVEELK